jgi:preprotein translocase subunit YajC
LFIPAIVADLAFFLAQTTKAATTQDTRPALVRIIQDMGIMLPLVLILMLFMIMSSRSRKKQEAQKREMLENMKRGVRVQTIGGIIGNVVDVRDDRVQLKLDESNNTKVWFARSAINRVLGDEAEEKK